MRTLFTRLSTRRVQTYHLVLIASGIPHRVRQQGSYWAIEVAAIDRQAAVRAIGSYLQENAPHDDQAPGPVQQRTRTYSACFASAALVAVHIAIRSGFERQSFFQAYGADAARILEGEFYRCVTALLLHADGAHLLANVAGILVFGTAVAVSCGWGLGWLLILISGAMGNFCTAAWYRHGHLSVGASTAVFAAVGICAVLTYDLAVRRQQPTRRAWVPLAGGLALLAFLGAAPGSDLLAHLFGFVFGIAAGGFYVWRISRQPGWYGQLASACAAAGLVVGGYLWGYYISG